mmetsp:Transcript_10980/g.27750  ORF Transcript_10980/g.27750 Transcript_10980/m.27750 type:complete len:255 (+) Transcript_10980:805-1569(+)
MYTHEAVLDPGGGTWPGRRCTRWHSSPSPTASRQSSCRIAAGATAGATCCCCCCRDSNRPGPRSERESESFGPAFVASSGSNRAAGDGDGGGTSIKSISYALCTMLCGTPYCSATWYARLSVQVPGTIFQVVFLLQRKGCWCWCCCSSPPGWPVVSMAMKSRRLSFSVMAGRWSMSWRCVAKRPRHRLSLAKCSSMAAARQAPAFASVPLHSSSTKTSESLVASLTMALASAISTAKVLKPSSGESALSADRKM